MASVRFLGFDERGWPMLLVPGKAVADGPTRILRVTIGDKTVELLHQQGPMKVYVNPEAKGFDEWETPPGSGFRLLVGSPSTTHGRSHESKSSVLGGAWTHDCSTTGSSHEGHYDDEGGWHGPANPQDQAIRKSKSSVLGGA